MGAPRQHIRRGVRIGVRLPANHDEIADEVAQQNVVLDLRVLFIRAVSSKWALRGKVLRQLEKAQQQGDGGAKAARTMRS